jgi:hypothetical protein
MSDEKPADPNAFKDVAEKSLEAGIADESAAYEQAIERDDKDRDDKEPEAHPS